MEPHDQSDSELPSGTRLGPYVVECLVGAGGMGQVYRARDERLDRAVAIKLLPARFSDDPGRLRRFELEARLAGSLSHPNVLGVYDVGRHEGSPFIVTVFRPGQRRPALGPRQPVRLSVDHPRGASALPRSYRRPAAVARDEAPDARPSPAREGSRRG